MIWDQFFLTRVALVIFSTIAAMFWLIAGALSFTWFGIDTDTEAALLLIHSLGMTGICAGFFGQRRVALAVILVFGLFWFPAAWRLLAGIDPTRFGFDTTFLEWVMLCLLACSGFALFFITWLLLRNSRQVPGHFREF